MKKKTLSGLIICASAGAIFQTALANDAQIQAGVQSNGRTDANGWVRGENPGQRPDSQTGPSLQAEPSASHPMHLQRATELIGMDVRNQQDEKLGSISDVMVDLQSGQAPFAVLSSGGFFGVGDRLLAIPTANFQQSAGMDQFVLNMDRERLKAAPTFDKNNWPNMDESQWRSEIYSYYGQPASQQSSMAQTTTTTEINEAAGAQPSRSYDSRSYDSSSRANWASESYGETPTGLSRDRKPRQGLGAEDLTRNEQKLNNPEGYARSDAFISESAGADRHSRTTTTTTTEERATTMTPGTASHMSSTKVKRATDLIGMEVKNAQNERIGEIKDVVIDMSSGRVAYTVLDAAGMAGTSDKLYAVPPSVFTGSSDNRWLVFNTDKEMLSKAPSFEKNNWPQANNQQFTSEVYRYYHQQPYWQSSRQIQEPSGAQPDVQHRDPRDSSEEWQQGKHNRYNQEQDSQSIQEPSGAQPSPTGGKLNEPTPQTEPERNSSSLPDSSQVNGSAAKETAELQSTPENQQNQSQVNEPAGATSVQSTPPATSEDQTGSSADRQMSQRVRASLQDAALSSAASNVQVSTANGRITLRGSVASEQEKQSIGMKAQEIAGSADKVDNQLQVRGDTINPSNP